MKPRTAHRGVVPSRKRRVPKEQTTGEVHTLDVLELGVHGDGIARLDGKAVYIAGALPEEIVSVHLESSKGDGVVGSLVSIISPSPQRVVPPCPYANRCGGCQTQHLSSDAESRWKGGLVRTALAHRGLGDIAVEETLSLPPETRRRATFAWKRVGGSLVLGFNARRSHSIVDIGPCPVLRRELVGCLPLLREALFALSKPSESGDGYLCLCDTGLDICLDLPSSPTLEQRERLAALADALDLARLSARIDGTIEPLAVRRPPTIRLGNADVVLPIAAFLQPSREGEQALTRLVLEDMAAVDGPIADLFCGIGTFALPLAARGNAVSGWDGDKAAIHALSKTGLVKAAVRDLFRDPLQKDELAKFSAIVLDPPRAGAKEQCELVARYGPPRLSMISCNPTTFARDLRLLRDGGYRVERVVPVDQFRWSAHVEIVASLCRE